MGVPIRLSRWFWSPKLDIKVSTLNLLSLAFTVLFSSALVGLDTDVVYQMRLTSVEQVGPQSQVSL